MKIFDSRVQEVKYLVLREIAKQTWNKKDAFSVFNEISNKVLIKGEPPISCCIYKDRAIVADRMRIALGTDIGKKNTVQVVSIACDECPKSGHTVTNLCRGCLAHNCKESCPTDAIFLDDRGYAHIDKGRCVECGRCAISCKYHAITNIKRPCESACKVDAIFMNDEGDAEIIPEKCIVCGACVWECPFGAMLDKSFIVNVIEEIRDKEITGKKIYAIVAPAVASQYPDATLGQVITALKKVGFDYVVEVAKGADEVVKSEAVELMEKGFLTSSCCPAFVEYINVAFPELSEHISHTPSPMAVTGRMVKEEDPNAVVTFIGPCISKKWEQAHDSVNPYVDHVITFEELLAIFDSKDIKIETLEETDIQGASPFGRGFAMSGGVTRAVQEALVELGHSDFEFKPVVCNGIDECKAALMKAKRGKLEGNFIEGMICDMGCIGGRGTLRNKKNSAMHLEKYCSAAKKETIF